MNDNFEIKKEHLGVIKMNVEEYGFNSIIIANHCLENVPDNHRVGRLVQVRKKTGAFGSDEIIIRLANGKLQAFENQSFFSVSEEYKNYYDNLFYNTELDSENIAYTIQGKNAVAGFVVNSEKCGYTTNSSITLSYIKQ